MSPRLRVLVGTSDDPSSLEPITHLVNTTSPFQLRSDKFEGEVVVCIKGFERPESGAGSPGIESGYFERNDRRGITWSIQVRGRFLQPISADDVLFGNTFDRPLHLPWGSSAAFKFMNYIDPTLTHDLTSQTKPWALSPLVSTMPHLAHARVASSGSNMPNNNGVVPANKDADRDVQQRHQVSQERDVLASPFPPPRSITDDTSQLHLACVTTPVAAGAAADVENDSSPGSSSESVSSDTSIDMLSISDTNAHTNLDSTVLPSSAVAAISQPMTAGLGSTSNAVRSLEWSHEMGKMRNYDPIDANKKSKKNKRKKTKREHPGGLGLQDATQRRAYFSDAAQRKAVVFGPEDVIMTDFCYGFLEFSPTLSLRLPGGISFDLMRYWDGQPVKFVCCERKKVMEDGDPWGPIFWCVAIEMNDDDEDANTQDQGLDEE